MVLAANRRTPESHHTVAHVLVDGAPVRTDDLCQPAEHTVEHVLQLFGAQRFGQMGEALHVAEQHRELTGLGLHRIAFGCLDHLIDQFRRHVGTKQIGQLTLGAALGKIAVGHVQHKCRCDHDQRRGQRKHQTMPHVQPEIECHHRQHQASAEGNRRGRRQPRQQSGQQQTGDQRNRELITHGVIGP